MPLIVMKEVFTPLKLIGIRLFKSSEGDYYIKFWNSSRKKITG